MKFETFTRGQSLMEILFAVAIFTIGVVTIGYLVFDAFQSAQNGEEYAQARLLAREGIEAVRALEDTDFTELGTGTYGLMVESDVWRLAPSPDVTGKFTRSIQITDSGDDSKDIAVSVTWEGGGGSVRSVVLDSRATNWQQTGGLQEQLEFRTEYTNLTASGTELSGLEISNTGGESITVTGMSLMWEGPARLTEVSIDGTKVVSASTSPISSETMIDSADYTLNPYSGFRTIDYFRFDSSIENRNFVVTLFLHDGTHKFVYVTP